MLKLLAALCLLLMPIPAAALPPNIILVLVDDMSMNLMPGPDKPAGYMPNLAQLQADGMTFTSYIASNSLCCPSRASTFTGLLPHNTGVLSNNAPSGGYASFVAHGDEAKSFALSLQAAGYKTGFFGKYLNGYELTNPIPPGWNKWVSSDHAYAAYGYSLNNQGVVTMHDFSRSPNDVIC